MITNTGKNILAKYLIGQAPGYASHIAFGCGPKPLTNISVAVTNKTIASNVATLTTATPHGFVKGDTVFISHVDTTFDGSYVITNVPTTTSFSYSRVADNVSSTALSPSGLATIDFSNKTSLDFEMFRMPIISRGYVTEDGVSQIVFTSELPSQERYEITEVGVYPAAANPSATTNDSKTLIAFIENESWEYHTEVSSVGIAPDPGTAIHTNPSTNEISVSAAVFQANASNVTFTNASRVARYERPRFLNNGIFMAGNVSTINDALSINALVANGTSITVTTAGAHNILVGDTVSITNVSPANFNLPNVKVTAKTTNTFTFASTETGSFVPGNGKVKLPRLLVDSTSNHIHLTGKKFDLNKNSPTDELRLAFSVVNKVGVSTDTPSAVRVVVEFATSDSSASADYARFEVDLVNGTGSHDQGEHYFTNNRYVVISKKLQDLQKTSSFSWTTANVVKIYATVLDNNGAISNNFYVCLDAIRLENINSQSPLYGLTGYSVIKNTNAQPAIKELNTTNLAEFRFALDVQ
jgi:hypothetical protein